ncbi:MAG: peptide deformylase [Bacteroidota bacterium]
MKKLLVLLFLGGISTLGWTQSDTLPQPPSLSEEERAFIYTGEADSPMRLFLITNFKDSLLLRTPSARVQPNPADSVLTHFIDRLHATVTDPKSLGVGIAAPQVGLLRRIIWVQRFDKEGFPWECFLNPTIKQYTRLRQEGPEGCLSIPDERDEVNRGYAILIEYDRPDGSHQIEMVEDFTAVIFQHEIDHLNGILYKDHLEKDRSGSPLYTRPEVSLSQAGLPQAQDRWQQQVAYSMDIDFDVKTHRFTGKQQIAYTNHSPDTLKRVFYHLFFNAFQPGSMMDVRSRTIDDPSVKIGDRIFYLNENQIGYHKIDALSMDGEAVEYEVEGSILSVNLNQAIMPGQTVNFDMAFHSQVPVQIRRSGRDNKEGIAYSMAQWFPKLCEYDYEGWHANPYIGREFHGVWGDFEVRLTLDSSYTVAASGFLQNPEQIGHGYQAKGAEISPPAGDKLTWHFLAENVHDFVWAADPDYTHVQAQVPDGPLVHFFYQQGPETQEWAKLPEYTVRCFQLMKERFGPYPYGTYSVIQGGDGGMEYPMATLITGHRSLRSLVGVTVHEAIHSWYQMVLGTNESLYPWMDEGFTSYAEDYVTDQLFEQGQFNPYSSAYRRYVGLVLDKKEEPLTTHSDHYHLNRAYGTAAYSKGEVILHQLGYVIGEDALLRGMKRYYHTWKFKHPNPTDFKRVMEKESGLELDWYFQHFVGTINTIDYGIESFKKSAEGSRLVLARYGRMPMPIDLEIVLKNGEKHLFYLPLRIMRGEKPAETNWNQGAERKILPDWNWTNPEYVLDLPWPKDQISSVKLDPTYRMADVKRKNNQWPKSKPDETYGRYKLD